MKHGGDLSEAVLRHGGTRADWLDLSTGINPHAWPLPKVPARFWTALPSRDDLDRLLDAARIAYRVPTGIDIVAAPGTQALIQWMPQLAPPGSVAVLGPTYNEHALACAAAGRPVKQIDTLEAWQEPSLILVNPNNPDGRLLDSERMRDLAREAARRGGWLIIDESFIDVAAEHSSVTLCAEGSVLVLRSFGKFYGLAGVRLGFAIADAAIARRFASALGPWAVAGPAMAIGAAALRDETWAQAMREHLDDEARALDATLGKYCKVIGGTALYRLVCHADAMQLHTHLAARHIWVRRFDWDTTLLRFGLPLDMPARQRLAKALMEFGTLHASPHGISAVSPAAS